MDDGIELNFAPVSGGVAVRRPAAPKGGRWTDRAKAKRAAKHTVKPQTRSQPVPAPPRRQDAPRPAPVSRPAPPPVTAPRPRPVTHLPNVDPKGKAKADEAPISPARSARATHAPRQASPAPTSSRHNAPPPVTAAGPSRLASAPAPKPKGPAAPQIISSLFSSNPLPKVVKSDHTHVVGAPSNAPLDTSTFAGLGLDPLLVRHLKGKMSVEKPTGIQRSALPHMLSTPLDINATATAHADDEDDEDDYESRTAAPTIKLEPPRDVFIQSQTGSGKTLTYLLPIIQTLLPLSRLSYIDRSVGTLAIVLAPTRELAQQISKVLEQILSMSLAGASDESHMTRWLVSGLLTGGATRNHDKARLRKGVPIIVSTPGRLLDHLQNTASFKCAKTMFLVLDEADRLMDLGFEETVQGIIKALDGRRRIEMAAENGGEDEVAPIMKWPYWSRGRQTVLCSATVDAKVERLAGVALKDPIVFRADEQDQKAAKPKAVDKDVAAALQEANAVTLPQTAEDKFTPPSQLSQKYVVVPTKLRLVALVALLRSLVSVSTKGKENEGTKIIVFLSSTDAVDFHWKLLGRVQMGEQAQPVEDEDEPEDEDGGAESADETEGDATSRKKRKEKATKSAEEDTVSLKSALFQSTNIHRLHGSLPLRTRMASLAAFAAPSESPSILFATSVASRGLDLPLVRAVVQYDLPTEGGANEYVHRVGRTARAGKGGEAWAFVGPSEVEWVAWAEGKMGAAESGKKVRLGQEGVEAVLKRGFGGKGYEYEARATEVQLALERWVLADSQNASLARKAYSSFVRAYSTHPLEEKKFFHPKSLHLGHLAKCFALREAPGALAASSKPAKAAKGTNAASKKRKRTTQGSDADDDDEDVGRGKESTARNETERRMYEAVRKAGRAIRSGGKLGEFRSGGGEFQVFGANDVERMARR
ncbi:ATP-dependent RNA helicase dbp7 [Saitozyma podzolica]|uniref:ATP-dependent RNA helicase n=1 Tax=Saitozyma podzolica TaxID=1890683 RepID=A0A427YMA3_9TREE|nr:ATP-dependent RNA helicase dbp7 [Saitozyma podzolica]